MIMSNLGAAAPYIPTAAHAQNSTWTSAFKITVPNNSTGFLVQALTQNVRMLLQIVDSSALATASIGFQLRAGDPAIYVPLAEGFTATFMQETATAVLEYQFVKTQTTQ